MEKKYFLGKRFNKIARFSYAITIILSIYGAAVYDYLFPNVSGKAAVILYLIWGAVCLFFEKILFDKARKKIFYVVTDKAFIIHGFGNSIKEYAYENITAVELERFKFDSLCPVKFVFGNLNLELKINSCLDDPCGVALEIIKNLPKRINVDKNLIEKLEALKIN